MTIETIARDTSQLRWSFATNYHRIFMFGRFGFKYIIYKIDCGKIKVKINLLQKYFNNEWLVPKFWGYSDLIGCMARKLCILLKMPSES